MTFSSQYNNGQFEGSNPTEEDMTFKTIHNYDLSTGVSFNSSLGEDNRVNYYIGAAAYHLTKPKQTFSNSEVFSQLNTKWNANIGVKYIVNSEVALTFHFNYSVQRPYQELVYGGLVSWKNISDVPMKNFTVYAGLFSRIQDALIPTLKCDYQNYSVTLSYDINNSSLKPATNTYGGFEISLIYRGKINWPERATDRVQCPRFEEAEQAAINN